jgi:hypothetical protein
LEAAEEEDNKNLTDVNAGTLPEKKEMDEDDDDREEQSGTKEPKDK